MYKSIKDSNKNVLAVNKSMFGFILDKKCQESVHVKQFRGNIPHPKNTFLVRD